MGNGYGSDPDQLQFPQGLFIESKTQILYVADVSNNRVQKLYPDGTIKTAAGRADAKGGSTADTLDGPKDVYADGNENVYVADWNNQRIQYWAKNAKNGKTVAGNTTRGSALNEFSYPSQVLLDSKKNIIVADFQNERVTQWSQPYNTKSSGTIIAVSY
jgi:sugar lactone lactonase YvrE